jgi:hypothetical protein
MDGSYSLLFLDLFRKSYEEKLDASSVRLFPNLDPTTVFKKSDSLTVPLCFLIRASFLAISFAIF